MELLVGLTSWSWFRSFSLHQNSFLHCQSRRRAVEHLYARPHDAYHHTGTGTDIEHSLGTAPEDR